MKLKYINEVPKYEEATPNKGFINALKCIDNRLDACFNRVSGRWEIYRLSNRGWQWILAVENSDESYRPLDNRTLIKLREMDIIARWGSVANYERHLDEKLKKHKDSLQRGYDHELKYDIKDNKVEWRRAADNLRSGLV